MARRCARILNCKGVTLIELIVAVMVLAVITIAMTAVFAPMLRTFERANNFAEVNTLLDNVAAYVMSEVEGAYIDRDTLMSSNDYGIQSGMATPEDAGSCFVIESTVAVTYRVSGEGYLEWKTNKMADFVEVLPRDFYKFKGDEGTVFTIASANLFFDADTRVVTFTLTIKYGDDVTESRMYHAKPIGLAFE